jgi:hypothetical protein
MTSFQFSLEAKDVADVDDDDEEEDLVTPGILSFVPSFQAVAPAIDPKLALALLMFSRRLVVVERLVGGSMETNLSLGRLTSLGCQEMLDSVRMK